MSVRAEAPPDGKRALPALFVPSPELRAFWAGLSGMSIASCVGALAVCVLELALCCWLLRPPALARLDPRYLMQAEADEYCALSLRLMRYRLSNLRALQVVYLGASTATRSLSNRDPRVLSKLLSSRLRRAARFNVFSANGQRYEDALVVADQLPQSFAGAFVLVVNDYKGDERLGGGALRSGQDPRFYERILTVSSPARDDLWRAEGHRPRDTGIFFVDHLEFFAVRRISVLRLASPRSWGTHRVPDPMADPDRMKKMRDRFKGGKVRRVAEHDDDDDDDDERPSDPYRGEPPILGRDRHVIDKLVDKLTARGIITVFVEAPLNPMRASARSRRIAQYYGDMKRFAAARGALYWNWNDELRLTAEDFADAVHLGSAEGRAQYQAHLMDGLAETLTARFGGQGQDPTSAEGEDENDDG